MSPIRTSEASVDSGLLEWLRDEKSACLLEEDASASGWKSGSSDTRYSSWQGLSSVPQCLMGFK